MKTTIKLLTILTLMVVALGQPTGASAGGGTNNGHFRDLGSDAYFRTTDPSGCIATDISISPVSITFNHRLDPEVRAPLLP